MSDEHDIDGEISQVRLASLEAAAQSAGYTTHSPGDNELEIRGELFFLDLYPAEGLAKFRVGGALECETDQLDRAMAQIRALLESQNCRFALEVLEEGDVERTRYLRDSVRPEDADTVRYELGSANAPDSPWGLDRIIVYSDGAFRYENQRADAIVRAVEGRLSPEANAELAGALERSGFPNVPEHETPPGADNLVITRRKARAFLNMSNARDLQGYGFLIETLDRWAAYLRGNPDEQDAPSGLVFETGESQ